MQSTWYSRPVRPMTLRAFLVLVGTCAALDANVWPDSRRLDGTGVSGVTARASPPTSTSRFGSGNASTVASKVLLLDGAQSGSGGRQDKSRAPPGCPVIRPLNPAVHDASHDNLVRSDRRTGRGSTTKELPSWRMQGFNSVDHRSDVPPVGWRGRAWEAGNIETDDVEDCPAPVPMLAALAARDSRTIEKHRATRDEVSVAVCCDPRPPVGTKLVWQRILCQFVPSNSASRSVSWCNVAR
jgi:hypothetical protein